MIQSGASENPERTVPTRGTQTRGMAPPPLPTAGISMVFLFKILDAFPDIFS